MRKATAALGSTLFLACAPGIVAGVVPWLLTHWRHHTYPLAWTLRAPGILLIAAGTATLVSAFARYVIDGLGTPAPIAPTERLVTRGPNRHVRNPMYLAVVATVVGQGLVLGQLILFGYAIAVFIMMAAFAYGYEEPTLARRFGAQYERYRRDVPAWLPRRSPEAPASSTSAGQRFPSLE